jgi:hypothetical protein
LKKAQKNRKIEQKSNDQNIEHSKKLQKSEKIVKIEKNWKIGVTWSCASSNPAARHKVLIFQF